MGFMFIGSRKKRGRSSWLFSPVRKIRVVDNINVDGPATDNESSNLRAKRRSSFMSMLGISREEADERVLPSPPTDRDDGGSTIVTPQAPKPRRRSSSAPSVTHRLSHKFSSTFGHPTVVHRTSLRSRPSVRSMKVGRDHLHGAASAPEASATSASNSGSGSSPAQLSTNPTSDSMGPVSMTSASRIVSFPPQQALSKLTPISETPPLVVPSIVTVEATAAAKIFFETHFKQIAEGHKPRKERQKELNAALGGCKWTPLKRYQAQKAFLRQESEFLRHDRVLKARSNALKRANDVSIAGYEVVKVLGKGSFGVVRLVKEKASSPPSKPPTSHQPTRRPSRSDLTALKMTAKEAFPMLAARRKDLSKVKKEVYAMKVIRKSEMLRNSQEGHLRAERDFLVASENSQWIVPLIAAFQDHKHLYLVMDYCIGGDFLGLLIRKNTLSEEVTRWYIAEMILCIEEAHRLQWIHRDVKPDNFLIGADGHLKVSDFGLAFDAHWSHDQNFFHNHRHSLLEKLGIDVQGDEQDKNEAQVDKTSQKIGKAITGEKSPARKRSKSNEVKEPASDEPVVDWRDRNQRRKLARSVVGTSQYMAPEVIRGELYDGRCDWWSIAIIAFECLYGFTPFACETRQETKLRILKHTTTLRFPDEQCGYQPVSKDAVDLMKKILQEKETRLSSPKYYLNDYAYSLGHETNTYHIHGPADKTSKTYQGRHVYSDDADEIKAHRWFKNMDWATIHRRKPPFVPKVRGWEDTKYFDDDEPVSDLASSSDDEPSPPKAAEKENVATNDFAQDSPLFGASIINTPKKNSASTHQHEDQHIIPSNTTQLPSLSTLAGANAQSTAQVQLDGGNGLSDLQMPIPDLPPKKSKKPAKEKKRPRDKILRDSAMAKVALDIRRRGAFLGYSYRRPKPVGPILERIEDEDEESEALAGVEAGVPTQVGPFDGIAQRGLARRDSGIGMGNEIGVLEEGLPPYAGRAWGMGGGVALRYEVFRSGTPDSRCATPA